MVTRRLRRALCVRQKWWVHTLDGKIYLMMSSRSSLCVPCIFLGCIQWAISPINGRIHSWKWWIFLNILCFSLLCTCTAISGISFSGKLKNTCLVNNQNLQLHKWQFWFFQQVPTFVMMTQKPRESEMLTYL